MTGMQVVASYTEPRIMPRSGTFAFEGEAIQPRRRKRFLRYRRTP